MHGVEVFRLLQDFLVAEQPFLLAKLNPQFLKASKYSTASCVLGPLYGSGTFSRHLPDIYCHSTLSLHRWVLQRRSLVAAARREVHACALGVGPQPREGLVTGAPGPAKTHWDPVGRCATIGAQGRVMGRGEIVPRT
jgi:hypothetical protein